MNPKLTKKRLIVISLFLLLAIILFNSRSVQLTTQDKEYIRIFLNDWHITMTPDQVHQNLENEISFISRIQDSVISQVKHQKITHSEFGNIAGYYINKKGQCFDRAVLMEKIFAYYHFRFRHVYVYFGNNNEPGSLDFFKRGLRSHALVEVKTCKGWLSVGTNSNWLGIDTSRGLVTISRLRKDLLSNNIHLIKKQSIGFHPFWTYEKDFRLVYGIYSRHGDLFKYRNGNVPLSSMQTGFHLLPDYNLRMLGYNFFK